MDSEFAETGGASEMPLDTRPLPERLVDKNWKTRQQGYDDLRRAVEAGAQQQAQGSDLAAAAAEGAADLASVPAAVPEALAFTAEMFAEFAPFVAKMTSDVHPGALDTGLDTALAFVHAAPACSTRSYAEKAAQNVIDKAFGARPLTQNKGKALLLKLMEVEECGPVCAVLLSKLSDKKPKVPPACLEVIRDGVALFGARAFPVKDIISALGPVLDGTNGLAREGAMLLLVDLCRWVGKAPLHALVDALRSAQKAEFERILAEREAAAAAAKTAKPTPTLYLRKDRPEPGSVAAAVADEKADGREYVDEVDLARKLRASDFAKLGARHTHIYMIYDSTARIYRIHTPGTASTFPHNTPLAHTSNPYTHTHHRPHPTPIPTPIPHPNPPPVAEDKWSEQNSGLQIVVDLLGPCPKVSLTITLYI